MAMLWLLTRPDDIYHFQQETSKKLRFGESVMNNKWWIPHADDNYLSWSYWSTLCNLFRRSLLRNRQYSKKEVLLKEEGHVSHWAITYLHQYLSIVNLQGALPALIFPPVENNKDNTRASREKNVYVWIKHSKVIHGYICNHSAGNGWWR